MNTTEQAWASYLDRARATHGDQLDLGDVSKRFLPYFQGPRIKVRAYGMEHFGTVSITAGWRPSLMLLARSDSNSGWILLNDNTELLAVMRNGRYAPTDETTPERP